MNIQVPFYSKNLLTNPIQQNPNKKVKPTQAYLRGNTNLNLLANAYRPITFGASIKEHLSGGTNYLGNGKTSFCIDAPKAREIILNIVKDNDYDNPIEYKMNKNGSKFERILENINPGDKYIYSVTNHSGEKIITYDPKANFLPNDINNFRTNSGWAEVIDHKAFKWDDKNWMENRKKYTYGWQLPKNMVMETMHVGLLGGFKGAKKEIDTIVENGVANSIKLMPIGEFYGDMNWGYDESAKFAVENTYGRPDDLKDFINHAHKNNIRVILDVVPNHFGPYGSNVANLADINAENKTTPWGTMLEFNDKKGEYLKNYMTDMLVHWAVNYHVDGFRFDATHYMDSDSAIKDINSCLRENEETKDLILFPEDMRISRVMANKNQPKIINEKNWGYDGLTTFDFYKSLYSLASNTNKHEFKPNVLTLEHIFKNGIVKSHEEKMLDLAELSEEDRKIYSSNLDIPNFGSDNFLINLSNHDEIGNEAGGKRNLVNILAAKLGMEMRCDMNWQQAQWLTFDMVKHYLKNGECLDKETQMMYGAINPVEKDVFDEEFHRAFAINKLLLGTTLIHPSPKEYFMGDERGELAPLKFFTNMPDDAIDPYTQKPYIKFIEEEKGYPPDKNAFEESKINTSRYNADWVKNGTRDFAKDLSRYIKTSRLLQQTDFSNLTTYSHPDKNLLEVKYFNRFNDEIIALMNFSDRTHDYFKLKSTDNIKIKEVINSNSTKYNGTGEYTNSWKSNLNSNCVDIAPHSIAIFEKVKN